MKILPLLVFKDYEQALNWENRLDASQGRPLTERESRLLRRYGQEVIYSCPFGYTGPRITSSEWHHWCQMAHSSEYHSRIRVLS